MTQAKPKLPADASRPIFDGLRLRNDIVAHVIANDTTLEKFYLSQQLSPTTHDKLLRTGYTPRGLTLLVLCRALSRDPMRYLRFSTGRTPKTDMLTTAWARYQTPETLRKQLED